VTDIRVDETNGRIVLFGHVFRKKGSLYDTPEDSKNHNVFAFGDKSPMISAFPVERVRAKVYAIPRFAKMENSMREFKKRGDVAVGENFEHVKEWVAVTLRHLAVRLDGDAAVTSFY
jgi:hypothetical protein